MKKFWFRNEKMFITMMYLLICSSFYVWAAQVAVISTDTREGAWAKETLNNSDLQTNIDLKADITSATLVTPNIGTPSAGVLTNVTGLPYTGLADGTDGELITWAADGTAAAVAVGTINHVLTSNGVGAAPTFQASTGSGDVSAAAVITDHSLVRGDGGAKGVQDSGILVDDSDNVSGIVDIEVESVTIPQSATAQEIQVFEASADGTNTHTISAKAMAASRQSYWPDWAIGFLLSDQVDASGNLAEDTVTYMQTSGSFKSLIPITDAAADFAANFTGADLYGGTFVCNVTGTIQLPAVAEGMNFTIITLGAIAVVVEPNVSDSQLLDGVQLDDADSATNLSAAGDIIVYQYYNATGWVATSNGWTDED